MKKDIIRRLLLMTVLIPISVFLAACVDLLQYKRIGDTNFYLVETMANSSDGRPLPGLYYSRNPSEKGFSGISLDGVPYQIFWNNSYIVVVCTDREGKIIAKYCIIKILITSSADCADDYEVYEYATKNEYEKAMCYYGLKPSEMNHTDNRIPWRLHLWD